MRRRTWAGMSDAVGALPESGVDSIKAQLVSAFAGKRERQRLRPMDRGVTTCFAASVMEVVHGSKGRRHVQEVLAVKRAGVAQWNKGCRPV